MTKAMTMAGAVAKKKTRTRRGGSIFFLIVGFIVMG
jgi:hypothetical protein